MMAKSFSTFLVIATGPKLAFEEVEGLGPDGHTHSICHVNHAVEAEKSWQELSRIRATW